MSANGRLGLRYCCDALCCCLHFSEDFDYMFDVEKNGARSFRQLDTSSTCHLVNQHKLTLCNGLGANRFIGLELA